MVVPLTGHVDRNSYEVVGHGYNGESCPSRGTWIEIPSLYFPKFAIKRRAPHGARG